MKIFNLNIRVTATMIAEIPDLPAEPGPEEKKPFNDDPLDKQAAVMDRYLDRVEKMMNGAGRPGVFIMGQDPDGASTAESVRIAVANFDDLQAVLKKFSETLHALPAAPDSLLASMQPGWPMPGR
jgi:hypothetical protein